MKVVIIGGGIAGLTQGIFLRKHGYDVTVYERTKEIQTRGHAFLMNGEGLNHLKSFAEDKKNDIPNKKVDIFSLKRPNNEELIKISLDDWYCIKRVDLIRFLISFYDEETLKFGYEFSHFEWGSQKATSAVFKNNIKIHGDIFIGADGSNSAIRNELFGKTKYTPIEVKEVVGISSYSTTSEFNVFQKFQSEKKGLSCGFIPASDNECVWFMQYDSRFETDNDINSPLQLKEFCFELLKDFPQEARDVLEGNNFSNTYIWNTRDFDLLEYFHKENVVLIGDAAHLALPFTSAGTTNAIKDAAVLTESLVNLNNLNQAFLNYYNERNEDLVRHIQQGRDLKNIFLDPEKYSERGFILPLISDKYKTKKKIVEKNLTITYFTDPICSSCWVLQPLLRKLLLEYEDYISIEYYMGGLLPNWEVYSDKRITKPSDAAKLWEEIREKENIPINGDVWLDDPLMSSHPPCIAFKAAQLQDKDKAIFFLRRLKEMLFMEKKNINKWENLERAALFCGLDAALLQKDMNDQGIIDFKKDLELANKMDIRVFPTLIFNRKGFESEMLKGLKSYEIIEETILKFIPNAKKNSSLPAPEDLFKLYNNMTEKEFAFLLNLDQQAANTELEKLNSQGVISKMNVKEVEYWKYQ
jgi:2-polyprenyl-6-methoxyphenol hydroxylase-like FAD-dependent oxidoreductase/predicted DsbA family dithiol-disulfide isomerase